MSPTPLIRRHPHHAYGFTIDTDPHGTVFVWVGHRARLTEELLSAINDAYQQHIARLTGAHQDQPGAARRAYHWLHRI